MCVAKIVVETEAFLVGGVQRAFLDAARHSPSHHRSSGTISSTARHFFFNRFRRCRDIVSAKQKRGVAFPQFTRCLFHVRVNILWLPVDFTEGGGTTVPLSGGLVGFVALRCYAEECAFSLSTQAEDRNWDLDKYKRVEPAYCPTGATSGGAGCERFFVWPYHPLCLLKRLVFCMTGVLELDLT